MKLSSVFYRFLNPSVKESLDELPAGICCYWPGGLVKLKNRVMESLSFTLFGEALMDGESFWHSLSDGAGTAEFLATGVSPVVRLPDGAVRGFSRTEAELEDRLLYIVTAIDLTDAYRRNAELTEKQQRTAAMVERQRALNREIDSMIREREILQLKTRVHDDLSRALLSGRQYLSHPDTASRQELIHLWKQSVRFLQQEGADEWRDGFENAMEAARAFGIALNVHGELPEEPLPRSLISAALVCCLSNAFRHAGADSVSLCLTKEERSYRAVITNNGEPPTDEVTETGGLADLRLQIENAGGTMRIDSLPRFVLTITVPKEEAYGL